MTWSMLRAITLAGCTVLTAPLYAGNKPVVSPPSTPIAITPTVVDAAPVEVVFSPVADVSPEVAAALNALEGARPGSRAAMAAVDALGAAIAQGTVALPVLNRAEAQRAIAAIDRLIAVLSRSGMPAPGLESLRAAVARTAE